MRAPVKERLEYYSRAAANGCHQWTGYIDKRGYGQISVNGEKREAYRVAYETSVGPVPDGFELDHLCRNRACINPAHLEPVTKRENILRGFGATAMHARKTTCHRGHDFVVLQEKTPQGPRPRRRCMVCQVEAIARYKKSPKGIAMLARQRERQLACASPQAERPKPWQSKQSR